MPVRGELVCISEIDQYLLVNKERFLSNTQKKPECFHSGLAIISQEL